ncbi:heme exporter protein CcmD [Ramlibacter sp. G-1-2-2]|uniref:Heme exporter protein CcmD n=1 Tax=Ramlibacter agri TaxID=2728837 RepID=A0A848H3Y6_9BURK|nr:heme exporter protein CcmD [Ramlibacter agri]NML45696.1 heme exporter protein CcmD [Ramlibacter agri]
MAWLASLSADGHTAYVVAAFGLAFGALAVDLAMLRRRWRAAARARA